MTILQHIAAANVDGDYPTTRDLADGLDVRTTVVRLALSILEHNGQIKGVRNYPGTFISRRKETRWTT